MQHWPPRPNAPERISRADQVAINAASVSSRSRHSMPLRSARGSHQHRAMWPSVSVHERMHRVNACWPPDFQVTRVPASSSPSRITRTLSKSLQTTSRVPCSTRRQAPAISTPRGLCSAGHSDRLCVMKTTISPSASSASLTHPPKRSPAARWIRVGARSKIGSSRRPSQTRRTPAQR